MTATVTLTARMKKGTVRINGTISDADAEQMALDFERRVIAWRKRAQAYASVHLARKMGLDESPARTESDREADSDHADLFYARDTRFVANYHDFDRARAGAAKQAAQEAEP